MRATGDLRALFARSRMFTTLDDADFSVFVEALHHRRFAAGGVLFTQGSPGDSLAIVLAGSFRVDVSRPGGKLLALNRIGPGDVIGEMTCVDPAPRSASVTAEANAEVLELDRGTLDSLARRAPAIYSAVVGGIIARTTERLSETNQRVERALEQLGVAPTIPQMPIVTEAGDDVRGTLAPSEPRVLRKLSALKGFSESELAMLVRVAVPREYSAGQALLEEGERGDSCLLLTAGSVEVVKTIDRRERRLAVLPSGSMVGQIALVRDTPRQATVRALEHVLALELSRHNFEKLLVARAPLAIRFQEQVAAASIRQLRLANLRLGVLLDRVDDLQATAEAFAAPVPDDAAPDDTAPPEAHEFESRASIDLDDIVSPRRQASIPTQVLDFNDRDEDPRTTMSFIQAALSEWGMRLEDLDDMKTKVPEGQVSRKESLLRGRR